MRPEARIQEEKAPLDQDAAEISLCSNFTCPCPYSYLLLACALLFNGILRLSFAAIRTVEFRLGLYGRERKSKYPRLGHLIRHCSIEITKDD